MKADHLHVYRPMPSTTAYSVPRYSIILAQLVADGFRSGLKFKIEVGMPADL
jgi:hypothetical protein